MADPRWIQSGERADGANHPSGYADIVNRANRDFYATFGVEHNDDGSHKTSSDSVLEGAIEFTGTGVPNTMIVSPIMSPRFIFGFRADSLVPFIWNSAAGSGNTKIIDQAGTAPEFRTDLILSAFGGIVLSDNPIVNAVGQTYYYLVI